MGGQRNGAGLRVADLARQTLCSLNKVVITVVITVAITVVITTVVIK